MTVLAARYHAPIWEDPTDETKNITFDLTSITTATTRTLTFPDANVDLADVNSSKASIDGHLDGGVNKHDGTEIDYERSDGSKKNIQATSDDLESSTTDLDDAIGALDATPTNYTPADASIVADHLSGIDTALTAMGTDVDAIHDNVAAEISAIVEKVTPVSGDLILIEDSADSNNKKKIQIGNLPSAGANVTLSNLTSPTAINQQMIGISGTAAAPAWSFTGQLDMGLFDSGTDNLGFAVAGVEEFIITPAANISIQHINPSSGALTADLGSSQAATWDDVRADTMRAHNGFKSLSMGTAASLTGEPPGVDYALVTQRGSDSGAASDFVALRLGIGTETVTAQNEDSSLIIIQSGDQTAPLANTGGSGSVDIRSGDVSNGTGNAGGVTIAVGSVDSGTRGNVTLDGNQVDVSTTKIINVVDPTAAQDAATKNYVDTTTGLQLERFDPNEAIFPSGTGAGLLSRNEHPIILFDDAADEPVFFQGVLSADYSGASISVEIDWTATTATTGDVIWGIEIEAMQDAGHDIDSDSFDTQQTTTDTTSGTSGIITRTTVILTNAEADLIAAGDSFRIRVQRNGSAGGDTMAGDAELLRVSVHE